MSQTRLGSFLESWANIPVGFALNWGLNLIVLPWFGFDIHAGQAFNVGLIFTVVSVVRSYAMRRVFNTIRKHHT
jgi:hypothetical protein